MEDVGGGLGGYRGLRAELLVALKKVQPQTAGELAERFGLTPNALRRHLKVLEEDGLVRHRRDVRGVGAPVYAFSLTDAGEAMFPRRYASTLSAALEVLRETTGNAAVADVLAREWCALADDALPVLDALSPDERFSMVAELLTAHGWMAEVVDEDGTGPTGLRIHNCTMREIAARFPEACDVEARELGRLLGVPVTRGAHRLDGCRLCEYAVTAESMRDAARDRHATLHSITSGAGHSADASDDADAPDQAGVLLQERA